MKKIFISAAIVIFIAGLTVGVLYVTKPKKEITPIAETTPSKALILDLSKDYGACTLLSFGTIKSTLGEAATNLQPPENAGITKDNYFGDDVKDIASDSQTCIYAFAPGNKTETSLSGINAFFVKKTKYSNQAGPKGVIEQSKANPTATAISLDGDSAFYTANITSEGPGATVSFELLVFKNNESISYSIIQPTKNAAFTVDSAKLALLQLAK